MDRNDGGTPFGRYRLIEMIGEGGMGAVYKAHDTMMNRDVAIKVLPAELAAKRDYQVRFRREAQTAARLTEPHIIPIHESGEIDDQLYLVMPIVEGTDLAEVLRREGPMSPQRAVHFIEQLAAALDAAHAVGLVHRDIKPSNALVTGRDFVYLIDFGIAHDAAATKLTSTGMIVGTMAYMAPERFTAGVADARSDVYALACVLHECLTGLQPYPGTSMERQIAGHLGADPPRPSATRPELPAGFDDVIARGMAKNPDERYQSADQLAGAARDALSTEPSRTPAPAPVDPTEPAPAPVGYWAPTPPDPIEPQAVAPPRRSALRVLVPALLAVLLVGASAFAVTQLLRPKPGPSPQWAPYVAAARQGVIVMTSHDFRHAKADVQRMLDISTGKLRDAMLQTAADFAKTVEASKAVQAGTVTAAGLVSFSPPTAKVLVAATSKGTNAADEHEESKQWRYLVTVMNDGGQYKISDMEVVP